MKQTFYELMAARNDGTEVTHFAPDFEPAKMESAIEEALRT